MADDRIDIVIDDKVDPNIDKKIAAIGTASKSAHSSVKELAGELAKLRSNSISELSKALRDNATATIAKARADSMAAAATDKAAAAYLKSELALNRAVAAETRARTEATKLAAETAKAESAALRLAAAKDKEAAAQARAAAAAQAGQGRARFETLQGGIDRANGVGRPSAASAGATYEALAAKAARDEAAALQATARAAAELRAAVDPLWAAQERLAAETAHASDLFQKGAIDLGTYEAASERAQQTFNRTAGAIGRSYGGAAQVTNAGQAAKLASHEMSNLVFQLNDVFVSLASGQKPLTVFIQQGAQIGQIYQTSGKSLGTFGLAILNTLRLIETTTAASEAAALAVAQQGAANVAAANAAAAANVRAAETDIAVATAQLEMAETATAATIAQARLATAQQALAGANAEAAITSRATATAQSELAGASTAARAATTTSLTALGTGVAVAGVALAAGAAAFGLFSRSVSKGVDTKEMVKGLGLTSKEVKRLKDVSVDTGDVVKATFQVLAQRLGINMKSIKDFFGDAMDFLTKLGRITLAGLYASFVGTFRAIGAIVKGVFDGKSLNDILADAGNSYKDSFNEASNAMIKFGDDVTKTIAKNKLADLTKQANEIKEGRGKGPKPKVDHTEERRAAALDKVNRALDAETAALKLVGPEREAAAKFDEINNSLLDKKIRLTDKETASIKAKIAEIQRLKPIQEQMDRIYEEAIGPQRTYDATLEAANNLLAQGKISLAEYTRQINLAGRALDDATDPLAAINRGLDDQFELLGKFGRAQSQTQFLQQIRQAYQARGESIYDTTGKPGETDPNGDIVVTGSKKYRPEVQEALDRNKQLGDAQFRDQTIGGLRSGDDENRQFIDNYKKMLDEIDELRKQGDISEAESYKYRGELAEKYAHARLSTEESVLSQLSDLQNSSVKEIAAIGKAAAVAQATIDGYAAVQKALASAPPPFNYILAGVVGVAAAANVAKIAGVGFERGGYTGDGGRKEVMGVVHGQEFVVNAGGVATGRNREFLEMMNRGIDIGRGYEAGGYVGNATAAPAMIVSPGAAPNVTVNNYSGEPAEVKQTPRNDGGFDLEVVIGTVEKRLAGRMQQGGTPLNQSVERRYGLNPAKGNAR